MAMQTITNVTKKTTEAAGLACDATPYPEAGMYPILGSGCWTQVPARGGGPPHGVAQTLGDLAGALVARGQHTLVELGVKQLRASV